MHVKYITQIYVFMDKCVMDACSDIRRVLVGFFNVQVIAYVVYGAGK